jgi:hypothetical protein
MLTPTIYGLWIVSIIGAALLVSYIWKKKLHREFPIFFSFLVAETAFDLLNFVLNVLLSNVLHRQLYRQAYYYSYWTGIAVTTCLGFFVLQEIFRNIFRPYESLRTFSSTLFRWSTLVLMMVGVIMALSSGPSRTLHGAVTNYIYTIDRSVQLMQCGLVLFMYLFARQLGLTEGHRVFGITIGFGLRAAVQLLTVTLYSRYSTSAMATVVDHVSMSIYLIALVIWAVYMYRPEPERRRASVLEQTESLNYALAAATNGDGGAAFLPNVVDTVDRVLNKRAISISSEFKLRG